MLNHIFDKPENDTNTKMSFSSMPGPQEIDFNPQDWMDQSILETCGPYAYALNTPELGECKVGCILTNPEMDEHDSRGSSYATPDLLRRGVETLDGLHYFGDMLPGEGYVLAFFRRPDMTPGKNGLLILRRDSNGLWSYKPVEDRKGCRNHAAPRQVDFSQQPLSNPYKADLNGHSVFLGYAAIPYSGLPFYPRLSIRQELLAPFYRPAPIKLGL